MAEDPVRRLVIQTPSRCVVTAKYISVCVCVCVCVYIYVFHKMTTRRKTQLQDPREGDSEEGGLMWEGVGGRSKG